MNYRLMRDKTIYADKIQNSRIPLSRLEQIARAILDADRLNSYKSAYESTLFNKISMAIEDFTSIVQKARANSSGAGQYGAQFNASFDR